MTNLHPQARPFRLDMTLEEDEVDEHRFDACPCYERCLDLATEQNWTSWSCFRCPLWPIDVRVLGE